MKNCPYCGQQNADEVRFCGKCGKELPPVQQEPNDHEIDATNLGVPDTTVAADQMKMGKKGIKKYIWIPVVFLLLVCGIVFYFFGYPYIQYQQAIQDMDAGDYQSAKATFVELGDYKDAPAYVTESDYQIAKQTAETDLIGGLTLLKNMGSYKDSEELVTAQKSKILEAAKSSIGNRDFPEAEKYLNAIPEVEGVEDWKKELSYQRALDYENHCEYAEAKTEFEKIRGYKDVDTKLNSLNYQLDDRFIYGEASVYAFYSWSVDFDQDSGRLRTTRMAGYSPASAQSYDQTYFYRIEDNVIYGTETINDDYSTHPTSKPTQEIGRITDVRKDADGKITEIQISGLFTDEAVWFD